MVVLVYPKREPTNEQSSMHNKKTHKLQQQNSKNW